MRRALRGGRQKGGGGKGFALGIEADRFLGGIEIGQGAHQTVGQIVEGLVGGQVLDKGFIRDSRCRQQAGHFLFQLGKGLRHHPSVILLGFEIAFGRDEAWQMGHDVPQAPAVLP